MSGAAPSPSAGTAAPEPQAGAAWGHVADLPTLQKKLGTDCMRSVQIFQSCLRHTHTRPESGTCKNKISQIKHLLRHVGS